MVKALPCLRRREVATGIIYGNVLFHAAINPTCVERSARQESGESVRGGYSIKSDQRANKPSDSALC